MFKSSVVCPLLAACTYKICAVCCVVKQTIPSSSLRLSQSLLLLRVVVLYTALNFACMRQHAEQGPGQPCGHDTASRSLCCAHKAQARSMMLQLITKYQECTCRARAVKGAWRECQGCKRQRALYRCAPDTALFKQTRAVLRADAQGRPSHTYATRYRFRLVVLYTRALR